LNNGWSQAVAAARIGISPTALRAMETGDDFGLVEELLARVADVYGVSMDHIYGRSETAMDRFAAANVEVQSAQLNGIMSALAKMSQKPEVLAYFDELVSMLGNELPSWSSLQSFRDRTSQERMAMLQEGALALSRLTGDRRAVNYIGALVLQFAGKEAVPRGAYSLDREEHTLSRKLTDIDRVFGRDPARGQDLTPSRYLVRDVEPARKKPPGRPAKSGKKSTSVKVARIRLSSKSAKKK
jgi:transcriptional regulator with XRE-family HTH domain